MRLAPYALVAIGAAALYLTGLGDRSLWNPDEPRYAQVAREMAAARDPLLPRLNGEIYVEKPPLFFWGIIAAGAFRGGIDETAARLPSALAAIGATLLVFAIARRLFTTRAGWIAAVAFATSIKVVWQGRFGQIDMLLTALVVGAMAAWVRGWSELDSRWFWLFWVATGLATIAKGPAGLLPPLLSVLAFLAITRDRETVARMRIGRGLALWGVIVLAWLVPAAVSAGAGYLERIAFQQTVTRYLEPWHHFHPWYYYATVIPPNFAPWSLFLPTAVVVGWKELRDHRRAGFLFALLWAGVTVLFFSVSRAKRDVYVLQMFPALALMVGVALDRVLEIWPGRRWWLEAPLLVLAAVAAAVAAFVPRFAREFPDLVALAPAIPQGTTIALGVLVAGGLGAWIVARAGRPVAALGVIAGGAAAFAFAVAVVLVPMLDPYRSLRPVAAALVREARPEEPYAIYPRLEPAIVFYSGRRAVVVSTAEELARFASLPGRRWILARTDALDQPGLPLSGLRIVGEPRSDRPYALFGPHPGDALRGGAP